MIVNYVGALHHALLDVSDWVERGIEPLSGTVYSCRNGQIRVEETIEKRKGMQPGIRLSANGESCTHVKKGEEVCLLAEAEVPEGAGSVTAIEFDFKTVVFSFLPHQIKDLDALIKNLETAAPEIIGVATYEQCKEFTETLSKYQKFSDIRNVGAAIHSMVQSVNEKMDNVGYDENEEWTYLAKLFGSNAIPGEAANVIQQAIKKAEKKGTITSKNRWQLIEFLCADYLSGK